MEHIRATPTASRKQRWQHWNRLVLTIFFAAALFLVSIFAGLLVRSTDLLEQQLLERARTDFNIIAASHGWIADYGGVYVERRAGVIPNPWLAEPNMTTSDGRSFTLRSPADLIRELSERTDRATRTTFHIFADNPLNPDNRPDPFESQALGAFAAGEPEYFAQEATPEGDEYRYAARLTVEKSCLDCHAGQSYVENEARGGISVTFDVTTLRSQLRTNVWVIVGLCAASLMLLLGAVMVLTRRISHSFDTTSRRIAQLAMTDDLTMLPNRKELFERMERELVRARRHGRGLSCILLDIDHFKKFNELHGHKAGDMVLRRVADIIAVVKRSTDVAARYGGEEMVVMLPETGCEGAATVAEKIRTNIEDRAFDIGENEPVAITVSLGVACVCPEQLHKIGIPDDLLRMASKAMYAAKAAGRNRIHVDDSLGGCAEEEHGQEER